MRRVALFQFARYVAVGVVNTGFSYGIYVILVYEGCHFALANAIATILGIFFSFSTQGQLTFGNSDYRLIFRFIGVWGVIWLLNVSFIALLMNSGLDAFGAGFVALPPMIVISFLIQKFFVFVAPRSP